MNTEFMAFSISRIFDAFQSKVTKIPHYAMGVDIGSSSIKVVELERRNDVATLKTYGELQLGPYGNKSMGETTTLELSKLTEALVDIIRESSIKASYGVLSIPLSASFVTTIPMTIKKGETLEPKMRVEARKYIPVPLSDVTLDWSEIRSYGDSDATIHEILLAAIQNDALSRYQKLMASVNMGGDPLEIEVFSSVRGLTKKTDTSVAIIDLGAETNKLYVVNEGSLERLHRVYDGGMLCTKRIAQMLSVSFEEAENLKRMYTPQAPQAHDIKKAFVSSIERSLQEFRRVIEQYEARMGEPLGRILVTGGAASFSGIDAYMGDIFSRDVELANPFSKVAYPAFMEDILVEVGPLFATALGAALRPYETGA